MQGTVAQATIIRLSSLASATARLAEIYEQGCTALGSPTRGRAIVTIVLSGDLQSQCPSDTMTDGCKCLSVLPRVFLGGTILSHANHFSEPCKSHAHR